MTLGFRINGTQRTEDDLSPTVTVLDYLRERLALTGTKEGCAEGDCGACTICIRRSPDGLIEAVNSCLMLLPQIDGAEVTTVEGLGGPDGALDPVQLALIAHDGTQCGFCTPGFVMALHALRHAGEAADEAAIHDALAGNLCRCTGYRSIVAAAKEACNAASSVPACGGVPERGGRHEASDQLYLAPSSLDELLSHRAACPEAILLAGGTDLGLRVTKDRERFPIIIHTAHVGELLAVEEDDGGLTIGAAATYASALPALERLSPSFAALVRRIGSRQVRNLATIGGNIGNASPIGDTAPCLIALGAEVTLASVRGARTMPLEGFFLGYRRTALAPDEVIARIRMPRLSPGQHFRAYKVCKRFDQDISSVIGAFRLSLDGDVVRDARIAFGGMAATPKRASACEAALAGAAFTEDTMRRAADALAEDFAPIDDHRASASYRARVGANLLVRLYRDLAAVGGPVEVMAL